MDSGFRRNDAVNPGFLRNCQVFNLCGYANTINIRIKGFFFQAISITLSQGEQILVMKLEKKRQFY